MVNSIKQEPMECAIEPPLKKIKQEVLSTQCNHFTYGTMQSSYTRHKKF